jgi:hypothetical protein
VGIDWLAELRIQSQNDDVRRHLREASHERTLGSDPELQDYAATVTPQPVARAKAVITRAKTAVQPKAMQPDCGDYRPQTAHQPT